MALQSTISVFDTGTQNESMILRMFRFRHISELTIRLPASGLVLLDGPSGIGKTTLMDAISFVLYDKMGSSCYHRKDRNSRKKHESTSVQLDLPNGLQIYRQRRSDLLQLAHVANGIQLMDDAAQSYIDQVFGPYNTWLAGCYIQQERSSGFFTMSSQEKLVFLQQLTLPTRYDGRTGQMISGPEQFEQLLTKTIQQITKISESAREAEIQTNFYEKIYLERYHQLTPEVTARTIWTDLVLNEHFQKYQAVCMQTLLQAVDRMMHARTQEIQTQISSERVRLARIEENQKQRAHLYEIRAQIKEKVASVPAHEKDQLKKLQFELTETTEQIVLAQRFQRKEQLLMTKAELQRQLNMVPKETSGWTQNDLNRFEKLLNGPTTDQLQMQLNQIPVAQAYQHKLPIYQKRKMLETQTHELQKQLDNYPSESLSAEIQKIQEEIWTRTLLDKKLTCPECSSSLYLNQGQLQAIPETSITNKSLHELHTEKSQLQQKENLFQQRSRLEAEMKRLQDEYQSLKSVDDFDPSMRPEMSQFTLQQLDTLLGNLQRAVQERNSVPIGIDVQAERKKIQHTIRVNQLETSVQALVKEIDQLSIQDQPAEIASLNARKQELQKKIQEWQRIQNELLQLESNLHQIQQQIDRIPEDVDMENHIVEFEAQLTCVQQESSEQKAEIQAQMQLRDLQQIYQKHADCQKQQVALNERLSALQKIKSTLITAEYVILDTFLGNVNEQLAEILEPLFDEPISVTLRSLKQLKTDQRIKPQINYEINIEGAECTSINEVSGGERSRISLALAIVFSAFNHAPFLMLDESLSSLNAEIKERTMETIRKYLPNKLVMTVNHDTTTGVYDSVIHLSK